MSSKLLLGRYEIVEKIGEGGMAVVYKAKDRLLNRYVAIKILRPEFTRDEQFIENFRRESQAAAGLSHPNIVNVYDVGREGNINFIVMELVDGKPLSQLIEEKGKLDYKEAINITKQVASALSLAHKNQIIHRDVKPHNILITSQGTAKLADFGIARAVSQSSIQGNDDKIMGSVHYFSPEQARGAYVDERSDIYSLGIVLYEMLTGKVPFDGDSPITIALMHINDPVPKVQGIPPQLEKIIEKATDKYQSNRYKTADEMIEDLDNIEFITKVMGGSAPKTASADASEEEHDVDLKKADERESHINSRKKSNKTKIFIIVAAVIVAVAGLVGIGFATGLFSGGDDEIDVPNFKGMTLDEAREKAEESGLVIEEGDEVYSADQEEGLITSQTPSARAKVGEGTVITVNISLGKKDGVVPSVLGMDYKQAEEYLRSFGFELGIVKTVTSTQPIDTIVSQSVKAGSTASEGTAIDVEVSDGKGKEMKTVPTLVGLSVDQAKSEIEKSGFSIGSVNYEESTEYAQNIVTNQQYQPGSELEEGTPINIVVSKGAPQSEPEPEPDSGEGENQDEGDAGTPSDNEDGGQDQ